MRDPLLRLAKNPLAKKVVRTLGLPVPMPVALRRSTTAYRDDFLDGLELRVDGAMRGEGLTGLTKDLQDLGARVRVRDESKSVWGLIYDMREASSFADLENLYRFVRMHIRSLASSGRVLIVGCEAATGMDTTKQVLHRAWHGFVKSLGKELGRRGITVNGMAVGEGAQGVAATAAFLLSPRAAFISGQILHLSQQDTRLDEGLGKRFLDGRHVLVTGAAQGIGAAIARTLAREGAKVIALDRPAAKASLATLCDEIDAEPLLVDLSQDSAVDEICTFLTAQGIRLFALVNNAGITRDKTLVNMSEDLWRQSLAVNLALPLRLSERVAEAYLTEGGRIICLSSINGISGSVGQTNYASGKAGIIGLVEAMAPRLSARGQAVMAMAPGFIETQMTTHVPLMVREMARRFNAVQQGGLPEDVAELALFLMTSAAGSLNGTTIRICGLNHIGA